MLKILIDLQSQIYDVIGDLLASLAAQPSAWVLASILPMGIAFGAIHALTPGHSKTVLAAYVFGSKASLPKALATSLILSATHVSVAVIIALFSLPLVSRFFGSAGRAPLLENISRGMLVFIGLWMIWGAFRNRPHLHGENLGAGFVAGLVPCPLTLFVMSYAMLHNIPQAGIAFAAAMLLGVAFTLTVFAGSAVLFRERLSHLLTAHGAPLDRVSKWISAIAGLVLVLFALRELIR